MQLSILQSTKPLLFLSQESTKQNISDLDKKRILRAIEFELEAKGMTQVGKSRDVGQYFYKIQRTGTSRVRTTLDLDMVLAGDGIHG